MQYAWQSLNSLQSGYCKNANDKIPFLNVTLRTLYAEFCLLLRGKCQFKILTIHILNISVSFNMCHFDD